MVLFLFIFFFAPTVLGTIHAGDIPDLVRPEDFVRWASTVVEFAAGINACINHLPKPKPKKIERKQHVHEQRQWFLEDCESYLFSNK